MFSRAESHFQSHCAVGVAMQRSGVTPIGSVGFFSMPVDSLCGDGAPSSRRWRETSPVVFSSVSELLAPGEDTSASELRNIGHVFGSSDSSPDDEYLRSVTFSRLFLVVSSSCSSFFRGDLVLGFGPLASVAVSSLLSSNLQRDTRLDIFRDLFEAPLPSGGRSCRRSFVCR